MTPNRIGYELRIGEVRLYLIQGWKREWARIVREAHHYHVVQGSKGLSRRSMSDSGINKVVKCKSVRREDLDLLKTYSLTAER